MKRKPVKNKPQSVYQLKITLRESKPPIWRRVLVTDNITLYDLHLIIQVCMGWTDSHLHQFFIDGEFFHLAEADIHQSVDPMFDERLNRLDGLGGSEKSRFIYQYDFGDNWEHDVLLEKITPIVEGEIYPRCIKGKGACPPEDCGGIWGYYDFLKTISNPKHEGYEDLLEWVGGEFDPEHFDLEYINQQLTAI